MEKCDAHDAGDADDDGEDDREMDTTLDVVQPTPVARGGDSDEVYRSEYPDDDEEEQQEEEEAEVGSEADELELPGTQDDSHSQPKKKVGAPLVDLARVRKRDGRKRRERKQN